MAGAGVAVAGIGLVVAGASLISGDGDPSCPTGVRPPCGQVRDTGTLGRIYLLGGAAAAITGVVMFYLGRDSIREAPVSVGFSQGTAHLLVRGQF